MNDTNTMNTNGKPEILNPKMKRVEDTIVRVLDWALAVIIAVAVALMIWGFFFRAAGAPAA